MIGWGDILEAREDDAQRRDADAEHVNCDACGEPTPVDAMRRHKGRAVCHHCLSAGRAVICVGCWAILLRDEIHRLNEEFWCNACMNYRKDSDD